MSGPTHVCREPGCGQATSEQKPYCFDHLARMPAVAAILRRTGAADAREERKSAAMRAKEEAAKRPCPACGGRMPPPKRLGAPRRYCSQACSKRHCQRVYRARATSAPRHVAPAGDHSALDTPTLRAAIDHLNTGLRLLAEALAAKGA